MSSFFDCGVFMSDRIESCRSWENWITATLSDYVTSSTPVGRRYSLYFPSFSTGCLPESISSKKHFWEHFLLLKESNIFHIRWNINTMKHDLIFLLKHFWLYRRIKVGLFQCSFYPSFLFLIFIIFYYSLSSLVIIFSQLMLNEWKFSFFTLICISGM